MKQIDKRAAGVIPSDRQLKFQQLEFYAFFHFTVNTFTDREWGDGSESPSIFNPQKLDAGQWVRTVKAAGMKGAILTCKHHDGFCLWPSLYTEHSVKNSPYKNGKGDIVREVSEACKREGLAFGIYLSPWDRNHPSYGYGEAYNTYFINQLTELLTGYGDIFSVWLDGACGEGTNGLKQVYDWERYYETVRRLQPNACISVCGPDIRWCGNEAGDTRPDEWSVVPKRLAEAERTAGQCQQADNAAFRERRLSSSDLDLGSRRALEGETDLIWYPAEVNTSIRPGWFYHESEDKKIRPLQELLHIYYRAVGGNATFLLNVPPTKEGLIHSGDVMRLAEMGRYLENTFAVNYMEKAELIAMSDDGVHLIDAVKRDSYESFYKTADHVKTAEICIHLGEPKEITHIVLKEQLPLGQRTESFEIYAVQDKALNLLYKGHTIGYKKIAKFDKIKTARLVIKISDSRAEPALSFIGIY